MSYGSGSPRLARLEVEGSDMEGNYIEKRHEAEVRPVRFLPRETTDR